MMRVIRLAIGILAVGSIVAAPDAIAQAGAPPSPAAQNTDVPAGNASVAPAVTPDRNFSAGDISELLKKEPGGTKAALPAKDDVSAPPKSVAAPVKSATKSAANDPDLAARPPVVPETVNATRFARVREGSRSVDPVVLKAEILLDRAHAPPGVIDGRYGSNFVKAIRTFEEVRGLEVDGKLSRRVWDELGGDNAAPVLGSYTIKPEDVVGPFYPDLSPDYAEQAKLPDLGYRSAEEMFGERFHMDKRFLRALNPGIDMGVAGNVINVALVDTLPFTTPIARIDVDKGKGQVLAYDADGMLAVAYPATIGSDELPSPSGSYEVRGIAPRPTYTYDPKKNFQQGNNTKKLILQPGPNNPVGAAFIALTKPTYGIHGTPDASKIDKTRSHGCVRLTNWNAQELSKVVTVGVPVNFIDKPGAPAPEPDQANLADDPIGALVGAGQ